MFFLQFSLLLEQNLLLPSFEFLLIKIIKELIMADYKLIKESKEILRQFSVTEKTDSLLCPILKVLQMRHKDLDTDQATRVIREILHD